MYIVYHIFYRIYIYILYISIYLSYINFKSYMYRILRILVLEIAIRSHFKAGPARRDFCRPAPQQFLFVEPALCRDYKICIFNARFGPV